MRRNLIVLCLSFATLLWVAASAIPHHHHNGTLVLGVFDDVESCHNYNCENSNNNNTGLCCDNGCEECPFSDDDNSIIKKGYDEKVYKYLSYQLLSIESDNHLYDFILCRTYKFNLCNKICFSSLCKTQLALRAPPFFA